MHAIAKGVFMFHSDFLMRQIQLMTTAIANMVFNKESVATYDLKGGVTQSETNLLYVLLRDLADKQKINEAENLLFEMLDRDNHDHFIIATDFYRRLNSLSDKELEEADFSREEIVKGLNEVHSIFRYSDS